MDVQHEAPGPGSPRVLIVVLLTVSPAAIRRCGILAKLRVADRAEARLVARAAGLGDTST